MKKPAFLLGALTAALVALGGYALFTDDREPDTALPKWQAGAVARLSDAQLVTLAYNAGWRGDDLVRAVAVALAESGGYPDAFLWNKHKIGAPSQDRGLWQINSRYHPTLSAADAFNPVKNAAFAYQIWQSSGFSPWVTFNKNSHVKFLKRARNAAIKAGYIAGKELPQSELATIDTSPVEGCSGCRPALTPVQLAMLAASQGWTGQDLVTAVAVALAESTGYPAAEKAGNIGLWQIAAKVHKLPVEQLQDPGYNAAAARRIYLDAKRRGKPGWWPWGAYRDGRYLKFISQAQEAVAEVTV